jgi:hypothetical protein
MLTALEDIRHGTEVTADYIVAGVFHNVTDKADHCMACGRHCAARDVSEDIDKRNYILAQHALVDEVVWLDDDVDEKERQRT